MLPVKQFYMIRHGETEANAAQIMAGWTDSPLTETGRQQARKTQKIFLNLEIRPTAIIHSNLSRAKETAEIINQVLNIDLHEDPDLAEMNAGDMEGQPYETVRPLFEGWPIIKNAEHPQEFFDRVKRAKRKALSMNGPVLIVCHGGVMRAFGEIYGISAPSKFKNAHLHDFHPNDEAMHFPWNVYHYDICDITGSILKEKSEMYSAKKDQAACIAS